MSTSPPRLKIRNLTRSFQGRRVVDDVSLTLAPGQVVGLLGPSGCGKTTTLRIIAGVERPDQGEVWVDGRCVSAPDRFEPPEQRGIGLMFQDFALFPHLSVAENVGFGLKRDAPNRSHRVAEMLERVGLSHHAKAMPHALSGGEQQRVALARALAPKPRIMLMDEPFSGLDKRLRDEVRDETLSVLKSEDTAVLLVTHEPEEAMRMADEIALMRAGKVVQTGAPWHMYHAPADRRVASFFSDINIITAEVQGALAETPFGQFLAPGHADGSEVEIVFRPQHLLIDLDRQGRGPGPDPRHGSAARGVVTRARFMGLESLVELRMDYDGSTLKALVPNVFMPSTGTPLWLTVRRDRCFVFPKEVSMLASHPFTSM